jgi:hypothetical protein
MTVALHNGFKINFEKHSYFHASAFSRNIFSISIRNIALEFNRKFDNFFEIAPSEIISTYCLA